MVCERVRVGNTIAIVCSRPKTRRCAWCSLKATLLCDHPVNVAGRKSKTCDAPMCPRHGVEVGPDRHYCPDHRGAPAQKALPFD